MAIQLKCRNPECQQELTFPDQLAGKAVRCPKCGKSASLPGPAAASSTPTRRRLGQYEVVRKLGEGGMGAVYEAVQRNLDRRIALKVLPSARTSDAQFVQRFQREAKAAGALNHPHIIQVYDCGEEQGRHFIAMEFVDGESLGARLKKEGKLPLREALETVQAVARALQYAHGRSIIHRDIKPDNIMVTRDGVVKLADLGLAKSTKEESSVTQTGVALGTPYYMAPEQAQNARRADHRADIYALGITLMHLVTGKRPFEADSSLAVILAHLEKPLPMGRDLGTELPPEVDALIQKMSAKDPAARHQDYDSLLADIERILARPPAGAARASDADEAASTLAATPPPAHPAASRAGPAGSGPASVPPAAGPPAFPAGPKRSRRVTLIAGMGAAAFLLLLVFVGLVVGRLGGRHRQPPPSTPTSAVSTTSAPPALLAPDTPPVSDASPMPALPPLLEGHFDLPGEGNDEHGNPVREGVDPGTGYPLEMRHRRTGMHFVFIPAGEFFIGSPEEERDRDADEGPRHRVTLSRPFCLGKYEVTQAEWDSIQNHNPSHFRGPRNPVEQVSRLQVLRFLEELNRSPASRRSFHFSLPTEAEWEYACRAGSATRFFFGDDLDGSQLGDYAWYEDNCGGTTHPVGQKRPNPWGLYDLHGNVGEPCDWIGHYAAGDVTDPLPMPGGMGLCHRGGSTGSSPKLCRSAERWQATPVLAWRFSGLRLALQFDPGDDRGPPHEPPKPDRKKLRLRDRD